MPNELLLDIKRLADTETNQEALMRAVFDLFDQEADSPLFGLMTPSERRKGKISRVTFNIALKAIFDSLGGNDPEYVYSVLKAYLSAWLTGLRGRDASDSIVNPTLFRAIMLLFPAAAARVSDRYGEDYTVENFHEVLQPVLTRVRKADLTNPGGSPIALHESFRKQLESGFAIGRGRVR